MAQDDQQPGPATRLAAAWAKEEPGAGAGGPPSLSTSLPDNQNGSDSAHNSSLPAAQAGPKRLPMPRIPPPARSLQPAAQQPVPAAAPPAAQGQEAPRGQDMSQQPSEQRQQQQEPAAEGQRPLPTAACGTRESAEPAQPAAAPAAGGHPPVPQSQLLAPQGRPPAPLQLPQQRQPAPQQRPALQPMRPPLVLVRPMPGGRGLAAMVPVAAGSGIDRGHWLRLQAQLAAQQGLALRQQVWLLVGALACDSLTGVRGGVGWGGGDKCLQARKAL